MDKSLKITALQPDMLVRLFKQSGCRNISPEILTADLNAGAPQNSNGTINLIHYAAWLAKEDADDQSE